ncbi:MAG TPA: SMP-30/gluconolactonase/LRE family protein, partial [Burkholderiaceae bacterium]|nr:SMP-30/gluconolactonase/LRE family protein [Burkholderiaceae bacterium]
MSYDSVILMTVPAGAGLNRPECLLATRRGDLYAADFRGGVAHLHPDATTTLYLGTKPDGAPLKPNGIALRPDNSFLIADLSPESGGVFNLFRDGRVEVILDHLDGKPLPPTNFVTQDYAGRIWATVSTRLVPRALGYRKTCNDGFIVLIDDRGPRIVADGLGYTNECAIDPQHRWLYVNETFGRRMSRFKLLADGLSQRETVTEFGAGTFPDGLAFDAAGALWVTSIVSNRVIRVLPETGEQQLILEDSDAEHLAWVEQAYQAGELGRPHLDTVKSKTLRNISSLAFGGPDLRTAYLGCLLGDSIATFRTDVPGAPPVH